MTDWASKLTKDFGVCAADFNDAKANVLKSPSPSLNWSVGNCGFVEGKNILFFGPESGGKSLLGQLLEIAIQQKYHDGINILIDTEYSFMKEWFIKLGGDPSRLVVRQTNDPIKIFDWIRKDLSEEIKKGCPVKSIRIDSVKMICFPKDMKETSTNVVMGGTGASYLSSALKTITPTLKDNNITLLLIQQVYEELDQYKKMRSPYIIPDGRFLRHYCDYLIQVEKLDTSAGSIDGANKTISGSTEQIGHKVRTKVRKNRCGPPNRVAEFSLQYSKGVVSTNEEVYNLGKCLGLFIHPQGSIRMWQFDKYEPINGEENFKNWIVSNNEIVNKVLDACYAASEESINEMSEKLGVANVDIEG